MRRATQPLVPLVQVVKRGLRAADREIRPRGYVFPGWWIVGSSVWIQVLVGALLMQSYGAYFVVLERDFGWSKTALAGAFAMARIESGILGPLQGWLIDRYGPRAVMRVGLLAFGIGFVLFSRIESLVGFYLTFFLLAVGSSLGGFVSLTVALVNWFERNRAKAVAISQTGFSLGGLAVPLVAWSLEVLDWRATALLSGGIILAAGLPLTRNIHHRPSDVGETVDGVGPEPVGRRSTRARPAERDLTTREAIRTPAFWLLSLGHAFALLAVSSIMVHLVPHLTDGLGYTLPAAAAVVSLMTAMQMIGQLGGGWLGDRYDKRVIVVACMLAHGAGLLLLAWADSFATVIASAMLHGWAWGTRGPLMAAMRADYFGVASFGTIMGFSSLIVMLGMTAGPLIAGAAADRTGGYAPGFAALAAVVLLGSIFFALAPKPTRGASLAAAPPHASGQEPADGARAVPE